jgi:hypothetical protein
MSVEYHMLPYYTDGLLVLYRGAQYQLRSCLVLVFNSKLGRIARGGFTLNKRSRLAAALGVTKFIIVIE